MQFSDKREQEPKLLLDPPQKLKSKLKIIKLQIRMTFFFFADQFLTDQMNMYKQNPKYSTDFLETKAFG